MSLRFRLVLSIILLALFSLSGSAVIVKNLNILGKNQEMSTFKDQIYHEHQIALTLIQAAQSLLYQHQAGYSREIDSLVNDISRFEELITNIPVQYRRSYQESCNTCHDNARDDIDTLSDILRGIEFRLDTYRQHISILITTNDAQAQIVHHGQANAIGEGIIETIVSINLSAGNMIRELLASNRVILPRTVMTIQAAMATIVFISLAIMGYMLLTLHRLMSSLLKGTESIYRDDFSLRLPSEGRNDEFGMLSSRFNLMAEHLQERDREIRKKTLQLESANSQLLDLNENLEARIQERTAALEQMVQQLQSTTSALGESKRRLEAANVDLLKANQAKANFLSIVSHELKTPLSVINGFLSLILDERYQDDPRNLREAVEISRRRGQQLARMIDELIDLSRLDAKSMVLHMEPVSLDEALRDVIDQFREDLQRKQIDLKVVDTSHLSPVTCDPDKFKQIMTNLLGNAIKFSPEGSTIDLGCREEEDMFLFSCHDEGIGLAPEETQKIFEKFYQVDSTATRRYGGAGLGLSIVSEIVQLHGGKIWVESEQGKGCTFYFTIPRKARPSPPAERNLSTFSRE